MAAEQQPIPGNVHFQQKSRGKRAAKAASIPAVENETTTIEEALKNLNMADMKHLAVKTPVSILQELLSRRGITPTYELVQIEGAIHEPTFRYRVAFNDKDAMGAGKSKKEAKHAAAKNLIDKLTGVPFTETQITNQNGNETTPGPGNNFEDKVLGNPIGWLQELCMARRWPPPFYETEMEVGLPHERQFTIACVVLKNREIGQGKSKKIAKRLAAHKMWLRLQDAPLDPNQIGTLLDEEGNEEITRVTNILNRYGDLKDAHIPTLTNQHSYKVSQFHKTLKANVKKSMLKVQATCLNDKEMNYVQFLHEIASDHQFEVTYVDIEEKTYNGWYQCLVQLSTLPVAVCQGSGLTSKDAQSNAAHNALDYLKIMTKAVN